MPSLTVEQRRIMHRAGLGSRLAQALLDLAVAGATGPAGAAGGAASLANRGMPALITGADGDLACGSGLAADPAGAVTVTVNGVEQILGVDCYFTDGSGPRALGAEQVGDTLRWVGSRAGFQLSNTDVISFLYEV